MVHNKKHTLHRNLQLGNVFQYTVFLKNSKDYHVCMQCDTCAVFQLCNKRYPLPINENQDEQGKQFQKKAYFRITGEELHSITLVYIC